MYVCNVINFFCEFDQLIKTIQSTLDYPDNNWLDHPGKLKILVKTKGTKITVKRN